MSLASTSPSTPSAEKRGNLAGKLAALTGAAGAALAGEAAASPLYTRTVGVNAAVGIPGFTYNSPTDITPGTLRPPTSAGITNWDINGDGIDDLSLRNSLSNRAFFVNAGTYPLAMVVGVDERLSSLSIGRRIGYGTSPFRWGMPMTTGGVNHQSALDPAKWHTSSPGYFGFYFLANDGPHLGWGSLTIDLAGAGYGFKITEAYYQSIPNAAIEVGQVPVPELPANTSAMALLAFGAAGLDAWRTRRKQAACS